MKVNNFKLNSKLFVLIIVVSFLLNPISIVHGLDFKSDNGIESDYFESQDWENGIPDQIKEDYLNAGSGYDEDFDVGTFLSDNDNTYGQVWDPWVTKAAIHAIATSDDGDYMALAGGYLYDDEIHLYRWNYDTNNYDLVSEIGSGVFQSDVLTMAFIDSDYNNLTEIVAGSEDGFIYVFEQRHIYDPNTNSENEFDLVWKSPRLGRVFSLTVGDPDLDYRKDIIVGTGDTLRFYEYDKHGGYPFSEDHWIDFREVFSYKMPSQITAMGIADVDYDGLQEVAVGLRSGELILMENAGTNLTINGYPYPITRDNEYREMWNSGKVIRRSISDISGGDIDDDGQRELMIAVQGQGAFVLDNIDGVIGTYRVERPFTTWETNPKEIYPLDYYVDSMVNSSSLFNGTLLSPVGGTGANVYYNNGSKFAEPLNYALGSFKEVYPYSSHTTYNLPDAKDGEYTTFDATNKPAWAVFDFGYDEEASSNGVKNVIDLILWTSITSLSTSNIEISISQDGMNWFNVDSEYISKPSIFTDRIEIDVDEALEVAEMDNYQFLNVTVKAGILNVDVIETKHVNQPIYDALSSEIGRLTLKGAFAPTTVGFIATIDGSVLGIDWNDAKGLYEVIWDSWVEERWKLGKNVFDLQILKKVSRFPAWINREDDSFTFDLTGNLPDGGEAISYTVDNFYNFQSEKNLEFIVSSSNGRLMAYTQASPNAEPTYNALLTGLLFDLPFTTLIPSVNSYISYAKSVSDAKYFTASIVPMNSKISKSNGANLADNGYWLFVGQWSGMIGDKAYDVTDGSNDVAVFYLAEGDTSCGIAVPRCAFFLPILDFEAYKVLTLGNTEATGQMRKAFRESTWMPKIAAVDLIGSSSEDLIVTDGGIHLLETTISLNPTYGTGDEAELYDGDQQADINILDKIFGRLDTSYVADYFQDINENSKGRAWSSANPVDFDGDGDIDLILGFARYNETLFSVNKSSYGMTYWENQGSNEAPKWVEKKKAVTNNDKTSNFRVANFTDPVFIYEDYDFGDQGFDFTNGYHPKYRTELPTTLLMTQIDPAANSLFKGTVYRFKADYTPPTSFLAATYPEVKRIDINLENTYTFDGSKSINYGFHIFETWDNEKELEDWTLSMSSADLDDDGKNEIIVGDFNNNIFVFEHMNNNTYKRAFKSFDVNRTIVSDKSPYANEQFGGISGTFYRTLFDHVEYVIAGFDLNQNGRQEFIAATSTMIFIFETTVTLTDKIRDDTYKLVGMIDILDRKALTDMPADKMKITALSWAEDLTDDGRKELIVGVSSALLIFEINTDKYKRGTYDIEEIFYGKAGGTYGLYNTPGNYYLYKDYTIKSILVEDLDKDGRKDIVLAGLNAESARPLWSGFITILEWNGATFSRMIEDEIFDKTTKYNPINDLSVFDSDLDGYKELVIGHEQGIDIYEFVGEDAFLREVITSNPSYQMPERSYFKPSAFDPMVANPNDRLRKWKDVARNDNTLKMFYIDYKLDVKSGSYVETLQSATSYDDGLTWNEDGIIPINGPIDPQNYVYGNMEDISLVYNGYTLWASIVFRYKDAGGSGDDLLITYVAKNPAVGSSNTFKYVYQSIVISNSIGMSSRLFVFEGATSNEIGVATILNTGIGNNKVVMFKYDHTASYDVVNYPLYFKPTYLNGSSGPNFGNNFYVSSIDIINLDTPYTSDDRDYVFIFSGYRWNESLSLDYDLFSMNLRLNQTTNWKFNETQPTRTFSSGLDATNPSIIQEADTGNLMVTFEQNSFRPYGGLFAIWSNNEGNTWNGPYDMSHPLGLDKPGFIPFVSRSKETFMLGTYFENVMVRNFQSEYPVIAPGATAGYSMVYNVRYELTQEGKNRFGLCASGTNDIKVASRENYGCNRPNTLKFEEFATAVKLQSNFTWFELDRVQKLTVGDSDRDGRQEIFAASGKQAILFEFNSNSATDINFKQTWTSKPYERDLTEVIISDGNGNGLPELFIESDRGIINAFEVIDTTMGQADILFPMKDSVFTGAFDVTDNNAITEINIMDVDNDGVDDILYSTGLGQIGLISGATMTSVYLTDKLSSDNDGNFLDDPIVMYRNGQAFLTYNSSLHRFNMLTGVVDKSIVLASTTNDTEYISVVTFDNSTGDIFVALRDGTMYRLSAADLTVVWQKTNLPYTKNGDFLREMIMMNGSYIFIASLGGLYAKLDLSGNVIWSNTAPALFYSPAAPVDINQDGITDYIFITSNFSFAVDGNNGKQIWNSTTEFLSPVYSDAILKDLNFDGIDDIVYFDLMSAGTSEEIYAIDSTTGQVIWSNIIAHGTVNIHTKMVSGQINFGDDKIDLLALNTNLNWDNTWNLALLMNHETGMSVAAMPSVKGQIGMGVSNFGGEIPYAVVGDVSGNITLYKLYKGQPELSASITPEYRQEPFLRVGEDFSKRTTFLLSSAFKDGQIGNDGVDDIFVVDDFFLGGADTYKLENDPIYNEAVWSLDVPEFGKFGGFAEIVELQGDGNRYLVASFEYALTAVNIETGAFLWNYTYPVDDNNYYGKANFIIDDLEGDGKYEIIMGKQLIFSGNSRGIVMVLEADGSYRWSVSYSSYDYAIVAVANFAGGDKEVLGVYSKESNPYESKFVIFGSYGIIQKTNDFTNMPSISKIATGDFDTSIFGDEFILYFDLSSMTLPSIIYDFSSLPTLFFLLGFDGTFYTYPSGMITLSPVEGQLRDSWVIDTNNDGNDDLVGLSKTGNLFTLFGGISIGLSMVSGGVQNTITVPYARNMIQTGNFCGSDSYIFVSSATSVSCFKNIDFIEQPLPEYVVNVDISIIHDIVKGDLDGDTTDDFIIVSRTGYVWIVSSESNAVVSSLPNQQNVIGLEVANNNSDLKTGMIVGLVGILSSPFIILTKRIKFSKK